MALSVASTALTPEPEPGPESRSPPTASEVVVLSEKTIVCSFQLLFGAARYGWFVVRGGAADLELAWTRGFLHSTPP